MSANCSSNGCNSGPDKQEQSEQQQQQPPQPASASSAGSTATACSGGCGNRNNALLPPGAAPGGCWKSTPGANGIQPPRLSLSAILPLSAVCNGDGQQQQQQQQKVHKSRHSSNLSVRTMRPGATAYQASPPRSRARRFFRIKSVRRSLAIDAATIAIFVPLSISTSLALMKLFIDRVGADQLEWHHYLLVAALASLVLVPVCRLSYSCHQYLRRLRRMAAADLQSPGDEPPLLAPSGIAAAAAAATAATMSHVGKSKSRNKHDYTTKSKRIEAADAARALEYREFACLVAKQQRIDLSRRDVSAIGAGELSCHRPDISMAAYNC